MKHSISYLILILGTLVCNALYCQDSEFPAQWDLEFCLKYATEHNININTLRLTEQSSEQDIAAAKGAKIPNLSGSLSNTVINSNHPVIISGYPITALTTGGYYSLNSAVTIWNGGYLDNTVRQKELVTQTANLSVAQSINNITLLITQYYLTVLLAKENLKYAKDLVAATAEKVKQGQLFYEAGSIPKTNLLQLQAQLSSDKYLQVQVENSIRQNILNLKQLLQLPSEMPFDIVTPTTIEVSEAISPLKNVQDNADATFPEIKIGRVGLDIAKANIDIAKAGFKPTLAASGALGTSYHDILSNSSVSQTPYFSQASNNFYQSLGLSLAVPIFSNRINKTNLRKAKIGFNQSNLNLQTNRLILSQQVEQTYLNFKNSLEAYYSAREQLQAVTETYRIGNEQFKLGGINSFDLLQLRNQYVQGVQSFTQAKYTAVLQQKIYEFYNGTKMKL